MTKTIIEKVEKLVDDVKLIKDTQEFETELVGSTLVEMDNSIRGVGKNLVKQTIKEMKQKIDINKDGKTSVKEILNYARKSVDDVFKIIFVILGSMILTTGIMYLRDIVTIDIFYLILQLTAPTGLVTAFVKKLMSNMGDKCSMMEKTLKETIIEKDQYRIAYELKAAHDKEFRK